MSKKFNLLSLHQPGDIHPRTWICLNGAELKGNIRVLEKDALEARGYRRENLSKELSTYFHCSRGVIRRILQAKSEYYPIPAILELSKLSKNRVELLRKIEKNIENLKVNSASAKPVKAAYKLNENMAKILGAFMADGSLSIQIVLATHNFNDLDRAKSKLAKLKINYSFGTVPSRHQNYISIQANKDNFRLLKKAVSSLHYLTQTHYNIELTDEYKDSVEAFIGWIKEEFNICPNRFSKRGNAWRTTFSNKILARYLMTFFKIEPGPKTYTAFEPKIIKKSKLKIRKAFAKGVLMFDGCVTINETVSLSLKSSNLLNSVSEIFKKDGIKFGKSINRRGEHLLFTTRKNRKEKLLKYFEPNTQKWKLLNWLSGNSKYIPIIKSRSSVSLEKIMEVIQKVKTCDAIFLKKYFKCSHTTIRSYLKILKNRGQIKLSSHPIKISNSVDENTTILLTNKFHNNLFIILREKFKKDKIFAKFLGTHKATLSAWRVRKNRIPIYILKEMCKVSNINFDLVLNNVEKADREIAEII